MFEPKAPLFQDPVYDGAADPAVIWNREEKSWWIFYTNRRASAVNHGYSFAHGTDIGIASSRDRGRTWVYRGTLQNLEIEHGRNTFWAPEVLYACGQYHMFVSYVQGIPSDWSGERRILHYTSPDLWDWTFVSEVPLSSAYVIDVCIYEISPGTYKMWYKDEQNGCHTYAAVSRDLKDWTVLGPEITDCAHEGPNVFRFENQYWMITDPWCGLGVYRSEDGAVWERRHNILREPGLRRDDGAAARHADVLVNHGHAYIFYFTHPEVTAEQSEDPDFQWEERHRRSSLQVAELTVRNGELECDRNHVAISLDPPESQER